MDVSCKRRKRNVVDSISISTALANKKYNEQAKHVNASRCIFIYPQNQPIFTLDDDMMVLLMPACTFIISWNHRISDWLLSRIVTLILISLILLQLRSNMITIVFCLSPHHSKFYVYFSFPCLSLKFFQLPFCTCWVQITMIMIIIALNKSKILLCGCLCTLLSGSGSLMSVFFDRINDAYHHQ